MFITCGLLVTDSLGGVMVEVWQNGPGNIRCALKRVLLFLAISAVCLSLAWLVTLYALEVLQDSSTEEDLKSLDFAVFLIGIPGCPLFWIGVMFAFVACCQTDLSALAF